jgi:uncharacterized protein YaaN involved in tellurite resistance
MRFNPNESNVPSTTSQSALATQNPEQEVQDRVAQMQLALRNAPEVQLIAQKLDVSNDTAILEFGKEPAVQISSFADRIMKTLNPAAAVDSGIMMKELTKIMKRVDNNELQKVDEGFMNKIFSNAKKNIEKLMAKYEVIGSEITKVNNEIARYEVDLKATNASLSEMLEQTFYYYQDLEKYIVAGAIVVEEMGKEDLPYFTDKAKSGQQLDLMELENVQNTIKRLQVRVADLESAKMVALANAIQIRMLQNGNYELISTINSAFIVTIPALKNGMINAIAAKQQKLVADSMGALRTSTNEFLIKSAQNTANQSVQIAKLAGTPMIEAQTVETMLTTLTRGIEETQRIEAENKKLREESVKKIHSLQNNMQQKLLGAAQRQN